MHDLAVYRIFSFLVREVMIVSQNHIHDSMGDYVTFRRADLNKEVR